MPLTMRYDLRAVAPTIARILDVSVPAGAETGPMREVLEALPSADRVAVVLIDGFGCALWDYVADAVAAINRLAGMNRMDIQSVRPPFTHICITTMLTGVSAEAHGVSDLDDMLRVSSVPQIDTLFDRVRSADKKTLLAVHRKGVAGLPLHRFADFVIVAEEQEDAEIFNRAPDLIRAKRPALAFVHLVTIDEVAHAYGPYAPQVRLAAADLDRRLRALLRCLAECGYAAVTLADHGMHALKEPDCDGHLGAHDGSVEEDMRVPFLWASAGDLRAFS